MKRFIQTQASLASRLSVLRTVQILLLPACFLSGRMPLGRSSSRSERPAYLSLSEPSVPSIPGFCMKITPGGKNDLAAVFEATANFTPEGK